MAEQSNSEQSNSGLPANWTAPLPAQISGQLEAALRASKAPATLRAYKTAWESWAAWCSERGNHWTPAIQLPADPKNVAEYLAHRFEAGAGISTLRMAVAAIGEAHRIADRRNPCEDPLVKTAMQGFARQAVDQGFVVKQAKGLTAESVAAIRGNLNGKVQFSVRHAKTMAIVSVLAESGLRISEAASLVWADVLNDESDSSGGGLIAIRKSKTDQNGEGSVVAITAQAMDDLDRLAALQGYPGESESVFGLSDRQIARRVSKAAVKAGLGKGYSGHSGRVGMAQRMTRNQAPAAAVMRQGRWGSTRMVARYTRNESAGEARRYL